jgi:hypothetical protein
MPRPGPRRPLVAIRLGDREREQIDTRARVELPPKGDGAPNRSEMIRRLLDYGLIHMPPGWQCGAPHLG